MASTYEFITVGGGEYFVDVFNGLAMLVKSGDYANVLKLSLSLSFMATMLYAAFSGSVMDTGKWFVTTMLVSQILLYPKTSLHVTDKTNPALMGAQIDNVPWIIAYTAETTSKIGYALTKQFESVYSLPDDMKYTENGMIFGVNMLQAMQQARITNTNLSSSVNSFVQNCIFYDIMLGMYSMDDFKNTTDIWNFVRQNQSENRFFTYSAQDGDVTYPTCKDGSALLNGDWNAEFQSSKFVSNLAFFAKKPDLTKTLLSSLAPSTANYFLKVSQSSEQLLQQTMMMNAVSDAMEDFEADAEVQSYQNARAQLQAKSTYQTMGAQAGVWIPMLKIVIEAVFYASFPIVVLLALIPGLTASTLRGYFTTFFWLAAWGPIYVILHRISMGHGTTYTFGLSDSGNLGFTLYNQTALIQIMNDIAAMAGYMSMFVPMIALGIARGGASAMGSMTTSFMSGIQGAVSTAAHEGTTGNLAFGNVGLNSRNISSGVQIANDAGQVTRYNNDGSYSIDNSRAESNLGFDIHGAQRIENSLSQAVSQEQSLANTKSMQAQQLESHGFERLLNDHRGVESSKGFEQNMSSEERSSFQRLSNAATDFAKEHSISREKASELFGRIGVSGDTEIGLGKIAKIGFGTEGGYSSTVRNADNNLIKEAESYSEQHHLSKDFQAVRSAIQSNRFNITDSSGESINESFSKSANLSKEAGMHFENAKRFSEQQQYVKSHTLEVNQNFSNEFVHHLQEKYGSHESVMQITNPGNVNKSVRDSEIAEFMQQKEREIVSNQHNPNLAAQYKRDSAAFEKGSGSLKQDVQPHNFSTETRKIDNSNLEESVKDSYSSTQEIINDSGSKFVSNKAKDS